MLALYLHHLAYPLRQLLIMVIRTPFDRGKHREARIGPFLSHPASSFHAIPHLSAIRPTFARVVYGTEGGAAQDDRSIFVRSPQVVVPARWCSFSAVTLPGSVPGRSGP